VSVADDPLTQAPLPSPADDETPRKSLTIGAVCKALSQEFPDISISKIRYLEDQKLLAPRRTPGGYRLYAQSDVSRLRTILRLQRDEFLPLRVIRQELAAGRTEGDTPAAPTAAATPPADAARPGAALRRLTFSIRDRGALYSLDDVVEETGAEPRLIKELEDYGIVKGEVRSGTTYYDETEREIVRAVTELSRYGVAGRNLRVFKTSAEREAALLQQILAPSLRSRNPERRKEAIEALENLAAVASHLKHLLLVRDLRRIAK
jgi:DNA-binding transcriptional MerR regulator